MTLKRRHQVNSIHYIFEQIAGITHKQYRLPSLWQGWKLTDKTAS